MPRHVPFDIHPLKSRKILLPSWREADAVFSFASHAQTVLRAKARVLPRGMTRAEICYLVPPRNCAGVLVLCPGWNGDGGGFLEDARWRQLAAKHRLLLVGLRFASADAPDAEKTGYHRSANGSGKLLFSLLREIVGRDVPVAVFGFSRGGQFAQSLAVNFPGKVRVWANTGSAAGDVFPEQKTGAAAFPAGLVMCGQDDTNHAVALETFFAGLRAHWRMCWLGVANNGHVIAPQATAFAQAFFDGAFSAPPNAPGLWLEADGRRGLDGFIVRCWFPDAHTAKKW
jgi:pimeloyl-ACP methyl ester carboxylesterase